MRLTKTGNSWNGIRTLVEHRHKHPRKPTLSTTLHDGDYWRNRAEEARAQAEQMSSPKNKRELLDIAAGYERLAELAEDKKIIGK